MAARSEGHPRPPRAAPQEELEKLAPLMVDAVKEEVDLVRKKAQEDAQAAVTKREAAARAEAEAASAERERKLQTTLAEATAAGDSKLKEAINKLVTLGYFSSVSSGHAAASAPACRGAAGACPTAGAGACSLHPTQPLGRV
jgi:hypothetical protein